MLTSGSALRARAAATAVVALLAGQAVGQVDRVALWSTPDSGVWSDAMRWEVDGSTGTGEIPQNDEQTWFARIALPAKEAYTVGLDIDVNVSLFELSTSSATLSMGGNNLTVADSAQIHRGTVVGTGGTLTIGEASAISNATFDGVNIDATGTVTFAGGTEVANGVVRALGPQIARSRGAGGGRVFFSATAPGGDGSDTIDICNTCVDSQVGGSLGFGGGGSLNLEQGSEIINADGSTFDIAATSGASITSSDSTGTVTNNGTIIRADSGRGASGGVFINNVFFTNNGTVEVVNGGLSIDAIDLAADGVLRGGKYVVGNSGNLSIVNSRNEVFTLAFLEADVTLRGEGSTFFELQSLARIGTEGRLRIEDGRGFQTIDGLMVDGELSIGQGSALDASSGGLGNIVFVNNQEAFVLRGGRFVVEGELFTGAEPLLVDVIDADVTLIGEQSLFSAIENASAVGSAGRFAIEGGRDFGAEFFRVVDGGTLRVGEGSVFDAQVISNFSEGVFDAGTFDVAGTLVANNAVVEQIHNTTILDGVASRIVDRQGNDAFDGLERIGFTGTLVLRNGRTIEGLENVIVEGTLIVEPGEAGGRAEAAASQFVAENILFTDTSRVDLLISGAEPGSFGAIFASGLMSLGEGPDGGPELAIRFDPIYLAQLGDSFELLRAGELRGAFTGLVVDGLSDGLSIELTYTNEALYATVVPAPASFAGLLALGGIASVRRRR